MPNSDGKAYGSSHSNSAFQQERAFHAPVGWPDSLTFGMAGSLTDRRVGRADTTVAAGHGSWARSCLGSVVDRLQPGRAGSAAAISPRSPKRFLRPTLMRTHDPSGTPPSRRGMPCAVRSSCCTTPHRWSCPNRPAQHISRTRIVTRSTRWLNVPRCNECTRLAACEGGARSEALLMDHAL